MKAGPARRRRPDWFGAHMSVAGGLFRAVERAVKVGCGVLQIFVKNPNQWVGRRPDEEEVERFRAAVLEAGLNSAVAHDSYLINLASPDDELWRKSLSALREELELSAKLGLEYLVVHPGAHLGSGESAGIQRIAEAIRQLFAETRGGRTRLALETTAGQGSNIGHRFEHLRDIMERIVEPERLAVCVDTCHVFAAGYDFRTRESYKQMVSDFDRVIGLGNLALFHLNDSRRELGSRVDRHAHIGKGEIGRTGFRWIVQDERFRRIPKILETPKGAKGDWDRRNLRLLRRLEQG